MRVRDYNYVRSLDELRALAEKLLADGKMVAFDVETSYTGETFAKRALDVTHPAQFVAGFSITNDPAWARYVPLRHDDSPHNLPVREAWEIIRPVLETLEVLAHHKKFEDKNLRLLAIKGDTDTPIRTKRGHDVMLQAYTLGCFRLVGLKELTKDILHAEQASFGSLFGEKVLDKNGKIVPSKVDKERFSALDPSTTAVINYTCDDSAMALELHAIFTDMLAKEPKNRRFIYSLEMDISDLMADVEIYGVDVDWEPMERQRALYKPFAARMETSVKEGFAALVKDPEARAKVATLNLGSAPQMQKLLYEDIGWRATRFSRKTDKPSTDKIALESLSRKYPAVKRLLQLREMNNLGQRHEKWLDEYRESYDQRVHPNFSQVRVVSGRFAADNPAIQQLPKHWFWCLPYEGESPEDVRCNSKNGERYWEGFFRQYIIARPGYYLLTYDYSQVELRVLAGVAREERLLQAFNTGEDVHRVTTAQMLGLALEEVTDELRQIGKTLNFALLYGMGPKSLADRLAVTIERANELYALYFSQFSSVSTWVDKAKRDGRRFKYAETFFGRKIPLWDLESDLSGVQAKGERVAVNGPIQGGAADYMKIAMVRTYKKLQAEGMWGESATIIMNQHDSLTFEVRNDVDPNALRALLEEAVVFPIKGFPVIQADWEIGRSWGASVKWKNERAVFDGTCWWPEGTDGAAQSAEVAAVLDPLYDEWDGLDDEEDPEVEVESMPVGDPVLVVSCPVMPTEAQLRSFVSLASETPGERWVEMVLDARPVRLRVRTGLAKADAGRISLALGGAEVEEALRVTDLEAASAGLSL